MTIENEIKAKKEQQEMVAEFETLKKQPGYFEEINNFEQLDILFKDEGEWWKNND